MTFALWLHSEANPDPGEWQPAVERLIALKAEHAADLSRLRSLVISDGGAPNAAQRNQLFRDLLPSHRSVVITNCLSNPVKRGVATVISWLNPNFRAFQPEQSRAALEHIGWQGDPEPLWREFCKLEAQVPAVRSLTAFGTALEMPVVAAKWATGSRP